MHVDSEWWWWRSFGCCIVFWHFRTTFGLIFKTDFFWLFIILQSILIHNTWILMKPLVALWVSTMQIKGTVAVVCYSSYRCSVLTLNTSSTSWAELAMMRVFWATSGLKSNAPNSTEILLLSRVTRMFCERKHHHQNKQLSISRHDN